MIRNLRVLCVVCLLCIGIVGCPSIEQTARDSIAAFKGYLQTAIDRHNVECTANPSVAVCQNIAKSAAAENAAVTSLETYCGWALTPTPPASDAKCNPIKSAEAGLRTALANMNKLQSEIKAAAQ